MPKVGKYFYSYKRLTGSGNFDVNFGSPSRSRIKQEDKIFWMELPPSVADTQDENLEKKYVYGKTNQEVIDSFKKAMDDFYSKDQTKKRVIGYKFDHDLSEQYKYEPLQFGKHTMSLQYCIGTELTIGNDKFFKLDKSDNLHGLGGRRSWEFHDFTFIDYTKEAEEWFNKTYKALENIIKACDKFFKQPEQDLIVAMKKQKLLS